MNTDDYTINELSITLNQEPRDPFPRVTIHIENMRLPHVRQLRELPEMIAQQVTNYLKFQNAPQETIELNEWVATLDEEHIMRLLKERRFRKMDDHTRRETTTTTVPAPQPLGKESH